MSPTTVGCAAALTLAACAGPPPAALPQALDVGANESLAMVVGARGVQVYECRAAKDPATGYQWAFVEPQADLFDARGKLIGRHGAGPYWESIDGSKTLGTLKQRAEAPNADAIAWLLLAARPAGPPGAFSQVTSIQRVNTVGGKAPADGCTRDNGGASTRIAYSADYRFFQLR